MCQRELVISNSINTDLLNKYIGGYAPYIFKFIYDLDGREVSIIFEKLTTESNSRMKLSFRDVLNFSETMSEDALDDNCSDSVIGMHMISENIYCVNSEKRELLIEVGKEPSAELI